MTYAGRWTICREGPDWGVNGVTIELGALYWVEGQILPLRGPAGPNIVGHAENIQRNDEGVITADLHFSDPNVVKTVLELPPGWGWTIFADRIDRSGDAKIVVSGRIRYGFLAPNLPWGEM